MSFFVSVALNSEVNTDINMSNFSSWFSRLRSSAKYLYCYRRTLLKNAPTTIFNNHGTRKNAWSTSLLPLALAVSAGSLALLPHFNPSFCGTDDRGVGVGGKGSTQYVVKGSQKEFPRELLQDLKIVCQDNISLDYDERYIHGKPQNSFHKAVNIPDVIVYPRINTHGVKEALKRTKNNKALGSNDVPIEV